MMYEISAGIVIFSEQNSQREYLILHYPGGHWDLPKGHLEAGETEKQAAERELEEETGIKASEFKWIDGYRHVINYTYRRMGQPSSKDVIFFLGQTDQREIKISHEHRGFLWLPADAAIAKLTFENAKSMVRKAEELLGGHA